MDFITGAGESAVLRADPTQDVRAISILSNLCLSILAMVTFLSKFYERIDSGKPLTGS